MHTGIWTLILVAALVLGLEAGGCLAASPATVDLTNAAVVTLGAGADAIERQAAFMLRWEVQKRTGLDLGQATALPAANVPAIVVGSIERMPPLPAGARMPQPVMKGGKPAAEGFVLAVDTTARQAPTVYVIGNDRRGALFAVGMLLRKLDWGERKIAAPADLAISTAPAYPIRGQQLGYRSKSDAYDAWDSAQYAQYIRDLILFGNNSIELIPSMYPGAQEAANPDKNNPLSPWDNTAVVSAICALYDMDVWMWIPLEDHAAENPELRVASLREREAVFAACPRIDAIFVPGGDPGNTPPQLLLPYLKDLTAILHKYHPHAGMWVSPQGFEGEETQYFYEYLRKEQPDWLAGIVYGPGTDGSLEQVRKWTPARYPIRHYPDVTHGMRCQYQIPEWDECWNLTYERQPILPRPTQMAQICNLLSKYTVGTITYSDGIGDDVNKIMFDAMLWDPKADVGEVLRDYGRTFVGPEFADGVADGLLGLEANWRGVALTNTHVPKTLAIWEEMEKRATPRAMASWRFQQGLIRAYGDAFVQGRLKKESASLTQAYAEMAKAPQVGSEAAMATAEKILKEGEVPPPETAPWRQRVEDLAGMLFQSIHQQLSVKKYHGSSIDRGAWLDSIDDPVTDGAWLLLQFPKIRAMKTEQEKLAILDRYVNWENMGPGSFYDDLGYWLKEPHLLDVEPFEVNPAHTGGALDVYEGPDFPRQGRLSWVSQTENDGIGDRALRLRYTGLDPKAQYIMRVVYGTPSNPMIQIYFDGKPFGEPKLSDSSNPRMYDFEVPRSATADGDLLVEFRRASGRWVALSEAWLFKKQ